ncbi:MAG: hypothetical protein ACRD96_04025, partial [Bryobacteraceae bacterium]
MITSVWIAMLLAQAPAPGREQPVGLILRASDGSLRRAGTEVALTARNGDILFAGDTLASAGEAMSVLYCPDKALYTVPAKSEIVVEAAALRVKSGQPGTKSAAPYCYLPAMLRSQAASQMHNGASMTRALRPETDAGMLASRLGVLPAGARGAVEAELGPLDQAIAADSGNVA